MIAELLEGMFDSLWEMEVSHVIDGVEPLGPWGEVGGGRGNHQDHYQNLVHVAPNPGTLYP